MKRHIFNKKIIVSVAILFLIISMLVLTFSKKEQLIVYKEKIISVTEKAPELNLPLKYFSDNEIVSGSGVSDKKNELDYAVLENGYQSFPTTNITVPNKDYSNEIKNLPLVTSYKEIFKDTDGDGKVEWDWLYKDQIKEYGDLATRFIPEGYTIIGLEKFDVDADGKNETIISLCGTGGNHCPHQIIIVKNNKIIFTADTGLTGLDLTKNDSGNGFYMHWVPTEGKEWDTGLCCPPGYMKTRFVYENGVFKPVYEQKVLYFTVNNKK